MSREIHLRRLGFILFVAAMLIQLFAAISPTQPSLQLSSNDLIPGGFSNQIDIINHCRVNDFEYRELLDYFKINCQDITNASETIIHANDYGNRLIVFGRNQVGPINFSSSKTTEENTLKIRSNTYYGKKLSSWDTQNNKEYKALSIKTDAGKSFFILNNCGCIITMDKPSDPIPKADDMCPAIPGTQLKEEECGVCISEQDSISKQRECRPCPNSTSSQDFAACLVFSSNVRNVTNTNKDANNTLAQPGDVLEYTLIAKNNGVLAADPFAFEYNIGDVLEYATPDSLNGGTITPLHILHWPVTTIQPGKTLQKTFTVTVKKPIPSTPSSVSDPNSYDLIMTSVYGNELNIKVPGTYVKSIEDTITKKSDTTPTIGLLTGLALLAIIYYFLLRTKMIHRELTIVRDQFTQGGGN